MIIGKIVIIRQLEIGDEGILHKWWNNEALMEHATLAYGTMQSMETVRRSIMKELEDNSLYPSRKRFIILDKDSLKPIGEMNYHNYNSRNQSAEFGIKICELDEQGKGYGYDALYHFIDYMFKFLNLNRIELTTMIDNKRAHKLYRKLGFKEIGIIREGAFDSRTGNFSDVMYMDLLKRERYKEKNSI